MASEAGFHRIRRAKSAPSVHKRRQTTSKPAPLASEIARYHATTAATLAMAKAKDRVEQTSRQTRTSSNSTSGIEPLTRTLRRRPSIVDISKEGVSTVCSHDMTSGGLTSLRGPGQYLRDKAPPADMSSVRGFEEELSAPSSYRRLHKSRSMFTTRSMRNLRVAGASLNHSEEEYSPSLRNSTESKNETHRSLRHSLSFFTGASQSIRRMKSHNAISTPRNYTMRPENEPPMPQMHWTVSGDGPVRKPFRTTVRTMRELSPEDDVLPVSGGNGIPSRARSFSTSIKKRLKRVFGFPSNAESQATERRAFESPYDINTTLDSPITADSQTQPSLYRTKSSESLATSASRVTSWTNSTAGNTVRTRQTVDRQSLSTIDEGCDFSNQKSADLPHIYEYDHVRGRVGRVIDSQRVYSALMRHIGQTVPRDGPKIIVSSGTSKGSPVNLEQSPSLRAQRSYSSIHRVSSDLSMKTARTSIMMEQRLHSSQSHASLRAQSVTTDATVRPLKTKKTHQSSLGSPSSVRVEETRSPFFPSGVSPRFKTPSPYKVAMTSIREIENDSDRYTPDVDIDNTNTDRPDPISPSIYSCTPSDPSASRYDLDNGYEEPFEPGMAIIYDAQVPYKSPKRHVSRVTQPGLGNSAEWRRWMSYQLDNIGGTEVSNLASHREHHREVSECDGEPIRLEANRKLKTSRIEDDQNRSFSRLNGTENHVQNNFSRPLSRQSMASLRGFRSPSNSRRQLSHEKAEFGCLNSRTGHATDPFLNEAPDETLNLNYSQSRRLAIRTAREARISRSFTGKNIRNRIDDQQDAKTSQFRSVCEESSLCKGNKENEMSPRARVKDTESQLPHLEDLHSAINSKRMVEMFLDSRRGRQKSLAREGTDSAFI